MVKQKHGKRRTVKPLDNKVKRWWAFLSINGTCQHVKELTATKAREFAVTQGYIGRYQITDKPKPISRRVRKAVKSKPIKSASPGTVPSAIGWCPECSIRSMKRAFNVITCENGHEYPFKKELQRNPKMAKHAPKKSAPKKATTPKHTAAPKPKRGK